jgi:hypothetical protein
MEIQFKDGLPVIFDPETGEMEQLVTWKRNANNERIGVMGNNEATDTLLPITQYDANGKATGIKAGGKTVPGTAALSGGSTAAVSVIEAAATFTAQTLADNGGNAQIASAGVHGLTTNPAVGASVYVAWSGADHAGVDGLYEVLSVDTTLAITIDLAYDADLGVPAVALANTELTVASVTVPGGAMGVKGSLAVEALLSHTNSAGGKTVGVKLGGSAVVTYTGAASNDATMIERKVYNRAAAVQVSAPVAQAGAGSGGALVALTVNTAVDQALIVTLKPAVANEVMTLEALSVKAFYAE